MDSNTALILPRLQHNALSLWEVEREHCVVPNSLFPCLLEIVYLNSGVRSGSFVIREEETVRREWRVGREIGEEFRDRIIFTADHDDMSYLQYKPINRLIAFTLY